MEGMLSDIKSDLHQAIADSVSLAYNTEFLTYNSLQFECLDDFLTQVNQNMMNTANGDAKGKNQQRSSGICQSKMQRIDLEYSLNEQETPRIEVTKTREMTQNR